MKKLFYTFTLVTAVLFEGAALHAKTGAGNTPVKANSNSVSRGNTVVPPAGNWCGSTKDNADFTLSLTIKKDSMYATYAYVKYNGSYLNAEAFDNDFAFVISKTRFLENKPINVVNYRSTDRKTIPVSIVYDKKTGKLNWRLMERSSTADLPVSVQLHKCR